MTTRDIVLVVIIPLVLAEFGPWCGWLASKLLPWAAVLRYGATERAAVRGEEWSGDLDSIPGQLTKLAYSMGQLAVGSVVCAMRKNAARGDLLGGAGAPVAEQVPIARLERSAVVSALSKLPPRQYEVLVLRYYSDLSAVQIASTMGISEFAVRSHTQRALTTLRSLLKTQI